MEILIDTIFLEDNMVRPTKKKKNIYIYAYIHIYKGNSAYQKTVKKKKKFTATFLTMDKK